MIPYTIYVGFRGRQIPAQVHKFSDYSRIVFNDTEIVLDFGGEFFANVNNKVEKQKKEAVDAVTLYRAIEAQLR